MNSSWKTGFELFLIVLKKDDKTKNWNKSFLWNLLCLHLLVAPRSEADIHKGIWLPSKQVGFGKVLEKYDLICFLLEFNPPSPRWPGGPGSWPGGHSGSCTWVPLVRSSLLSWTWNPRPRNSLVVPRIDETSLATAEKKRKLSLLSLIWVKLTLCITGWSTLHSLVVLLKSTVFRGICTWNESTELASWNDSSHLADGVILGESVPVVDLQNYRPVGDILQPQLKGNRMRRMECLENFTPNWKLSLKTGLADPFTIFVFSSWTWCHFNVFLCNSDKKDHLMVSRKKEDADNGIGALAEQISFL